MKRREFITLIGGAVAWPHVASAQRRIMPVVGVLHFSTSDTYPDQLRALHQGLKEAGYIEGENFAIRYLWAENQVNQLPALAAELVRQQVDLILTFGGVRVASAAKAATATIPIVFLVAEDPVRLDLVASFARPGGNLTGINFLSAEVAAKRLEFLRELVPGATRLAVLINPTGPTPEVTVRDVQTAALTMGMQIQLLKATNSREIEAAFATLAREKPDALFVGPDPLFTSRRVQLVLLATRHAIPTAYSGRFFAEAGGLMSYGSDLADATRQLGTYVARILKGAKPADLPVLQTTKFELVINLTAARLLGIQVPQSLQVAADTLID